MEDDRDQLEQELKAVVDNLHVFEEKIVVGEDELEIGHADIKVL